MTATHEKAAWSVLDARVTEPSASGGTGHRPIVAALDAVVVDARRAASQVRKPRRAFWLIPGAMLAVGALTAGALVVDNLLHADLPIAIEYTTDTGVTVSCTAEIEGGAVGGTGVPAPADALGTIGLAHVVQSVEGVDDQVDADHRGQCRAPRRVAVLAHDPRALSHSPAEGCGLLSSTQPTHPARNL